ncbi:MAG: hypothetical protein JNM13_16455 [Hyphomicrobiaceae bacterium]|nr:hypothetical protein [Hyphomicrobiaceae bacterium]
MVAATAAVTDRGSIQRVPPVARQNRVDPFGVLFATPARGDLMGNRGGRFHDPGMRELPDTRRPWKSSRWICCLTAFRGRHRQVWTTGYTELFFLDEVTALAAGHRPCFECRRVEAKAFQAAMGAGQGGAALASADAMDAILQAERLDGRHKRLWLAQLDRLPDGAMIAVPAGAGRAAVAVRGDRLLPWTPGGWGKPLVRANGAFVALLTPPAIVGALRAGYRPRWHASADPA